MIVLPSNVELETGGWCVWRVLNERGFICFVNCWISRTHDKISYIAYIEEVGIFKKGIINAFLLF